MQRCLKRPETAQNGGSADSQGGGTSAGAKRSVDGNRGDQDLELPDGKRLLGCSEVAYAIPESLSKPSSEVMRYLTWRLALHSLCADTPCTTSIMKQWLLALLTFPWWSRTPSSSIILLDHQGIALGR